MWELNNDLCELVLQIGTMILREFRKAEGPQLLRFKSRTDVLTDLDLRFRDLVDSAIKTHDPGIRFISEEGSSDRQGETCALVDPLDGSTYYLLQWPGMTPLMVSLIILRGGEIRAALIVDLWGSTLYTAECPRQPRLVKWTPSASGAVPEVQKPFGVHERIHCLMEATVSVFVPNHEKWSHLSALLERARFVCVPRNPLGMLSMGGRIHAILEPFPIEMWEHIGGILATLRGARIAHADGSPFVLSPKEKQTSVVAVSSSLLGEIVELLT